MGNCSRKIRRTPIRDVTLVTLGLDNAGKSTIISVIINSNQENVAKTVGYSSSQVQLRKCNVTISDLGGGSRIRGIWNNYYAESHGVIFVVDSSEIETINECKEELHRVLQDNRIKGKPIIIFANKQDSEDARDEIKTCDILDLENVLGENKTHCRVEPCIALYSANNGKKDPAIKRGISWLLDTITAQYNQINERVMHDVAAQREAEAQDRRERAERVRKIREERERAEALVVAAESSDSGQQSKDEADSENISAAAEDIAKEVNDRIEPVNQENIIPVNQENIIKVTVVKENHRLHETIDDKNGEESVERPTISGRKQQQESEAVTDIEDSKAVFNQKVRRDSGWYPTNWKMLLNAKEPCPPILAGISEASSGESVGNGHFDSRKPFGIRLKPLQPSRSNEGMNKRWKVSALLKKNNKTAPIMEENEEVQSSDTEHLSMPHNSWMAPGESTHSVQKTNLALSTTKSPANLWTMPINGAPVLPGNQQMFLPEDFKKDL